MDLPWGSDAAQKFVTNIGLVTTDGPHGNNIMSCEWTHQVSYSPGLIAVCLGDGKATVDNIRKSKEFGVNIASADQSVLASVAGGYSGKEYDKIGALKELGFGFYKAKKINAPMVKDAAMNAECRLFREIELGSHVTFVGEVVGVSVSKKEPLAYHNGKYWALNDAAEKPSDAERARIKKVVEKSVKSKVLKNKAF